MNRRALVVLTVLFFVTLTAVAQAAVTGTMVISNGAYVVSTPNVTVDSAVVGATQMEIRAQAPNGAWSTITPAPVPYVPSYSLVLPSWEPGNYSVSVTYSGAEGGPLTLTDQIVLDPNDHPDTRQEAAGQGSWGIAPILNASIDALNDPHDWHRFDSGQAGAIADAVTLEVTLTCSVPSQVRLFKGEATTPLAESIAVGAGIQRLVFTGPKTPENAPDYYLDVACTSGGGPYVLEVDLHPALTASPASLEFFVGRGKSPGPKIVEIGSRAGILQGPVTPVEHASWLKVDVVTAENSTFTELTGVKATVSSDELRVGTYATTITVGAPGYSELIEIPVTLHVMPPTAVRLTSSSTSVTYGGRIKYTIDARRAAKWSSSAPRDANATIEVLEGNSVVKTLRTDGRGKASFSLTHDTRTSIRVRRVRGGTYASSVSNTRKISVRWKCTLAFETYKALANHWIDVKMRVLPAGSSHWDDMAMEDVFEPISAGRKAQLQIYKAGAWRLLASGTLDENGEWEGRVLANEGKRRYRLYMPGGVGYSAGHSAVRTVDWR